MFEQMKLDQWKDAVWPKVQGSWNLHKLLPSGLDFFIMLSSISGIMGNRGQANYAAGNTFMDALAHHRVHSGERATSLNLGFFLSAGVVKESAALEKHYASGLPFTPVTESQLHSLLALLRPEQPRGGRPPHVPTRSWNRYLRQRSPAWARLCLLAPKAIIPVPHGGRDRG